MFRTLHDFGVEGLGETVEVLVENPRFSVVKRKQDGSVDFISPLPLPWNYGCIPGTRSGDGAELDALVLGPRLEKGERITVPVVGVVGFVDAGEPDPKVICSAHLPTRAELKAVAAFFAVYAVGKRALALTRGITRETRSVGFLRRGAI